MVGVYLQGAKWTGKKTTIIDQCSIHQIKSYCWWLNSYNSWYGKFPISSRGFIHPRISEPSTVSNQLQKEGLSFSKVASQLLEPCRKHTPSGGFPSVVSNDIRFTFCTISSQNQFMEVDFFPNLKKELIFQPRTHFSTSMIYGREEYR